MESNKSSLDTADTTQRSLARKLRRQVAEWKTMSAGTAPAGSGLLLQSI
jgi:hypothetical protein